MSELLKKINETNIGINEYHFSVQYNKGIIYEGERNKVLSKQYVRLSVADNKSPIAEMFWSGDKGYGKRIKPELWLNLSGKPFPDYLESTTKFLKEDNITSIKEEGDHWVIDIKPDRLPPRENPEDFYRRLLDFSEPLSPKRKAFLERMIELSRDINVNLRVRVSREQLLIDEATVVCNIKDNISQMNIKFSPRKWDIPELPRDVISLGDQTLKVPGEMLLFQLPKKTGLGGWSEDNHVWWAQKTIDLISIKDKDPKRYTEIYQNDWYKTHQEIDKPLDENHHPLVLGAYYEDQVEKWSGTFYPAWFSKDSNYIADPNYYFRQDGYSRDYNHYGGGDQGLQYSGWMILDDRGTGAPARPLPDDRYYSARDWGYGSDRLGKEENQNLNRLTFPEAIKQYYRYNAEGKRNAYLMMGHVLHLLQDTGDPDHAKLLFHPGSGYTERYTYLERYAWKGITYCEMVATVVALEACGACAWIFGVGCLACAAGAFGVAELACRLGADENTVGYEYLVKNVWLKDEAPKLEKALGKIAIETLQDYDSYFRVLSEFSKSNADELGLKSPLGCGDLWLSLPGINVQGGDPDIDLSDAGKTERYLDLTNAIVPKIIGLGAGIIQYFYEIVNYPPIVQHVTIINIIGCLNDLIPQGFSKFPPGQYRAEVCYDAEWKGIGWEGLDWNHIAHTMRKKINPIDKELNPDLKAYVFIQFGPAIPATQSKPVVNQKLKLVRIGAKDIPSINVELKQNKDSNIGFYYWGSFQPAKDLKNYSLQLEIEAKDATAHLMNRSQPGDMIDSNPATIAVVNPDLSSSNYPFIGYEPGVDRNHSIRISSSEIAKSRKLLRNLCESWAALG